VAAAVDLSVPALVRRRLARVHFDASHLPERFGLFLIIALGESIVAIGLNAASTPHLGVSHVAAVGVAFAVACGLWWTYFVFAASAVRHAVATAAVQTDIIRQVLAYGHLVLIGAIIAVAVGLADVVSEPGHALSASVAALLYGGCALYLATFGYTRWRMFRTWAVWRLGAAAVLLALLPAVTHVPAVAALGAVAVVVVALNVAEYAAVRLAASKDVPSYLSRAADRVN
jgi:low temperature requirement protein LtrA